MAVSDAIINIATRGSERAQERLLNIAVTAEALENRFNSLNNSFKQFNTLNEDGDKRTDKLNRGLKRLTNSSSKLNSVFSATLKAFTGLIKGFAKFSFIGLAAEIALFTAALGSVNLLLGAGSILAKGYQIALKGVATAAAGVVIGLSTAAAAVRQFQQAQLAPMLGGGAMGYAAAQRANRLPSQIAGLLGGEGAGNVVGSLVKGGVAPANINQVATTLFNLSGGNTESTIGLAGALAGGDFEKSKQAIESAAGFQKDSLKGVTNMQQLMNALSGGAVVKSEFQNTAKDLSNTLIGTFKTEFAEIKQIFADIGGPFLEPVKNAFKGISNTFKEAMLSISSVLQATGVESFIPAIERFTAAIVEFFRSNIIENVQNLNDVADGFVNFFAKTKEFFLDIRDVLQELSPASTVVIDMFKAIGEAAGGRGLFRGFAELVENNAAAFERFGASIGNVIGAVFDLLKGGNSAFFNKLDLITESFNVVAEKVIPSLGGILEVMTPFFERLPKWLEQLSEIIITVTPVLENLVKVAVDVINSAVDVFSMIAPVMSTLANAILKFIDIVPGLTYAFGALTAALFANFLINKVPGGKALKSGLGNMMQGPNAMRNMQLLGGGALILGGGYDAIANQTGGGLVGGLSAAGGTAMIGNALGLKGPMLAQAAAGVGGAVALTGGSIDAYKEGRVTAGNFSSTVGGGAALGASIGMVGGPMGALVGGAIGALVGGLILTGTSIWGQVNKNRGADEFARALDSYMGDLERETNITMDGFTERLNFRDSLRSALEAGEDTEEFEAFIERYRDMFNEMYGYNIDQLDQERLRQIVERGKILDRADAEVKTRAMAYAENMELIAAATGLAGEDIRRFADEIGYNLFSAVGNTRTAMAALTATMNNIDLNRGVIASAEGLPFFKEDYAASVNANLMTLLGGDITEQSLNQFLSGAAFYESNYRGASPLTAALGGIENLLNVGNYTNLTPEQQTAAAQLGQVGQQLLERQIAEMSAATNGMISEGRLMDAFTGRNYKNILTGEVIQTRFGSEAVQGMLEQQDLLESAYDLTGSMDPLERIKVLQSQGMALDPKMLAYAKGDEEANQLINEYLLTVGEGLNQDLYWMEQQTNLLQEIKQALGTMTVVNIDGVNIDLTETTTVTTSNGTQTTIVPNAPANPRGANPPQGGSIRPAPAPVQPKTTR